MSGKHATAEEDRIMVAGYQSGKGMKEAGALVGKSYLACQGALRRAGIVGRSCAQAALLRPRPYPFNVRYLQHIDSEEKAYILGFISADGCVDDWPTQRRLCIGLAAKDHGHLVRIRDCFGSGIPILKCRSTSSNPFPSAHLRLHSGELVDDLIALGVTPRKSLTLIPWEGPAELMRHYFRGLVDGDGSVCQRSDGFWSVSLSGSLGVVTAFQDFILSRLDWPGTINQRGNIFAVAYGGVRLPQRIAGLLYEGATIALPRKQSNALELLALGERQVRKNFSAITLDELHALHDQLGTWAAVARQIGIAPCHMGRLRQQRGGR